MGRIPTDVVELCILPKLPFKSLLRFKSVSKSWHTLISSNDFNQFRNRQLNLVHIFSGNRYTLHLHHLDPSLTPLPLCPYPYPYRFTPRGKFPIQMSMTILASCEYFLLLSFLYNQFSGLVLLNPFTRIYREIPDLEIGSRDRSNIHPPKYGLYLDDAHDDLKVVRIYGFCKDDHHFGGLEIAIFSLKTNLWTLIESNVMTYPLYYVDYHPPSVIKNLLYTILPYSSTDVENMRIGCFDVQAQRWINDVPLPHNKPIYDLCVFDGLLCALGFDKAEGIPGAYYYCAWVMNNYSWMKLMSIAPNRVGDRHYRPIAYRKGSRHEILCRRNGDSNQLFWYNLKDEEITKADFIGHPQDGGGYNN